MLQLFFKTVVKCLTVPVMLLWGRSVAGWSRMGFSCLWQGVGKRIKYN